MRSQRSSLSRCDDENGGEFDREDHPDQPVDSESNRLPGAGCIALEDQNRDEREGRHEHDKLQRRVHTPGFILTPHAILFASVLAGPFLTQRVNRGALRTQETGGERDRSAPAISTR
jgi:hypothetical protein